MTRRRVLLALIVSVLAAGCTAPWWGEAWLQLAYEKRIARTFLDGGEPLAEYHHKRLSLLPGAWALAESQACMPCRVDNHQECVGTFGVYGGMRDDGTYLVFAARGARGRPASSGDCICPPCHPERR